MAIIPQISIFKWEEIENLGDLEIVDSNYELPVAYSVTKAGLVKKLQRRR